MSLEPQTHTQTHSSANAQASGTSPGTSTGTSPGTSTGTSPGTSTGTSPGTSTGTSPGTSTGTSTGFSTAADAGVEAAAKLGKKLPVLLVSDQAVLEIKKLSAKREAEGKAPAFALRVGIRGGGCTGFGYLFEWCDGTPRATDRLFEFEGGAVKVVCDPKSLIFLDGTTLDYVTGLMGHGFRFVNPNVKGACGCGESVQF